MPVTAAGALITLNALRRTPRSWLFVGISRLAAAATLQLTAAAQQDHSSRRELIALPASHRLVISAG